MTATTCSRSFAARRSTRRPLQRQSRAPNPAAQEALLRTVYERIGVDPHEVDYVEAHGTGTPHGDPIEAGALGARARRRRARRRPPAAAGSAKTNFGHLEAAAGIVGLMKAALSLYHGQIPPSLHYAGPSPHINFDEDPPLSLSPSRPSGRATAAWPAPACPPSASVAPTPHVVLEVRRSQPPQRGQARRRGRARHDVRVLRLR